jgi:hypothetical protein
MATFVNVGAKLYQDRTNILTKAALKRLIGENPTYVYLYGTSDFTPFSGTGNDCVVGVKYQVTGPDPYTSRKWYATIEKLPNGKVTVK